MVSQLAGVIRASIVENAYMDHKCLGTWELGLGSPCEPTGIWSLFLIIHLYIMIYGKVCS